ncbi:MAG: permease [Ilumatobacteraceae bacterium]
MAATIQVALPDDLLSRLGDHGVLAVLTMAFFAIVMALCSESDAFIAASFVTFSPVAVLTFMVVGPLVDLRLLLMYRATFGTRRVRDRRTRACRRVGRSGLDRERAAVKHLPRLADGLLLCGLGIAMIVVAATGDSLLYVRDVMTVPLILAGAVVAVLGISMLVSSDADPHTPRSFAFVGVAIAFFLVIRPGPLSVSAGIAFDPDTRARPTGVRDPAGVAGGRRRVDRGHRSERVRAARRPAVPRPSSCPRSSTRWRSG